MKNKATLVLKDGSKYKARFYFDPSGRNLMTVEIQRQKKWVFVPSGQKAINFFKKQLGDIYPFHIEDWGSGLIPNDVEVIR